MSGHTKKPLRKDPHCQNCGHEVEARYCGHCGQKNVDGRMRARELFLHFFEDLTHYEGSFWSTLRYLFARPGLLTRKYLEGKRSSFLPPVRMYIFVSFITFLIPSLLPSNEVRVRSHSMRPNTGADTLWYREPDTNTFEIEFNDGMRIHTPRRFKSISSYNAYLDSLPADKQPSWFTKAVNRRMIHLRQYSPEEIGQRFNIAFKHAFPKSLFLYLPLFALGVGLFYSRKRWMYFDHGIHTLHFFSFVMLLISMINILLGLAWNAPASWSNPIAYGILAVIILGIPLYFVLSVREVYRESMVKSVAKSVGILSLNLLGLAAILLGLVFYALLSI